MTEIYFYFSKSEPTNDELTEENNDSETSKCLKQPNNIKGEKEDGGNRVIHLNEKFLKT